MPAHRASYWSRASGPTAGARRGESTLPPIAAASRKVGPGTRAIVGRRTTSASESAGDLVFQQRFRRKRGPPRRCTTRISSRSSRLRKRTGATTSRSTTSPAARSAIASRVDGPLRIAELVRVVTEVAAGLDALHEAGIVHRDIKPSNVLFDSRRDGDADRLRPRERTGVHRAHPARAGDGNARLPRARADPRTAGDAGHRRLCARLRRLRVRRSAEAPFADKGIFEVGLAHLDEPPPDPGAERPELSPAGFAAAISVRTREGARADDPRRAGAYADALRRAARGRETRLDAGSRLQGRAAHRPARRGRRASSSSAATTPASRSTTTRSRAATRSFGPETARSRSRTWAPATGRS